MKGCHCCGGQPDTQATMPRYCAVCRTLCKLVAPTVILRADSCPLITRGIAQAIQAGRRLHAEHIRNRPRTYESRRPRMSLQEEVQGDGSFTWRGKRRRNTPGGL